MTFEPERGGSSLASAASCGDASGIELLDPGPAARPGDTPAGLIVPSYVRADQAELVGFVRQYMSFLRPTSLNRMIRAIQRPNNQLFNRLYPEILNIEDGSYIGLSNDLWAKGKSQEQIEDAICGQIGSATFNNDSSISPIPCASAKNVAPSTSDRRRWKGSSIADLWY
jgi:hypothetical protein